MSSKFDLLLADLQRAVAKLSDVLAQPKNEYMRDSAIQRFEFTYELVWKTLKAFLAERHAVTVYSPKETLREAFQQGAIADDPLWLKSIELRNLTTHTYKEAVAEEIYRALPAMLALYLKLSKTLR